MAERFIGIDVGAEAVKVVELVARGGSLVVSRWKLEEHQKDLAAALLELLRPLDWAGVAGAAVTGRHKRVMRLPRVPLQQAQVAGLRHLVPDGPATLVSIGGRGFTVLEIREQGPPVLRQNSRCSQGTGNFLRQLVERLGLTLQEADALCAGVEEPAALFGRCPVILKTDLTHLANRGERPGQILAGLYDAVCENVQSLIKPRLAPARVYLVGGVSRASRIRENFRRYLEQHRMELHDLDGVDAPCLEALGAAVTAARAGASAPPPLDALLTTAAPTGEVTLEWLPGLRASLKDVRRLSPRPGGVREPSRVILGFDMGSTGSKLTALDLQSGEAIWDCYRGTAGDPVGAARHLVRSFVAAAASGGAAAGRLVGFGVTGSGREIVGSLLATCYGASRVLVVNEIASHAAGATHLDPEVDTIFEIGGQDAKYIRLDEGRVFDAAMNEACSAGTGSFIEEQGRRLAGVEDVQQLGRMALAADRGVSLGQHCSVFMAEVIDEAVSTGASMEAIVSGLYDSVIQNYLNRVKGDRSAGQKIFCQGMPFSSDALAAAVARQTGRQVVVPPDPGTIGALGVSLIAARDLPAPLLAASDALDPERFLSAVVERRDSFTCASTSGCGEPGSRCRIERLGAVVDGARREFPWGGACALHEQGRGTHKLPDRTPDPFAGRRALVRALAADLGPRRGRPVVAMTDEFVLRKLLPFFATFVRGLGFDLELLTGAGQGTLRRGVEELGAPCCAPLRMYAGAVAELLDRPVDYVLAPQLRDFPRLRDEPTSTTCPLVQASPAMLRWTWADGPVTWLAPVIDMGPGNYRSRLFAESCYRLARSLGVGPAGWQAAFACARRAQEAFDAACLRLGAEALRFCARAGLPAVVVLGRDYTIHNEVLAASVPRLLREEGAVGIPVDCYPVDARAPTLDHVYWGQAQRSLAATRQLRRQPGVHAIFCSNYSCGPDAFILQFFTELMAGEPFAIVESDGHCGDAGTRTRVEVLLHCIGARPGATAAVRSGAAASRRAVIAPDRLDVRDARRRGARLIIPRMGPGSEVVAAAFRSGGVDAESLPEPDLEALRLGRRHTSGKECLPMAVTLGGLLQRIAAAGAGERLAFFMADSTGPCRFGMYNLLDQVIIGRLGLGRRVFVVTPPEHDFFLGLKNGAKLRSWIGLAASDVLVDMLHHARPVERRPGAAQEIFDRHLGELLALIARPAAPPLPVALARMRGDMFGVRRLLIRAAREVSGVVDPARRAPTVALVGEIFLRLVPFSNGGLIRRLERRGLRVKLAPLNEMTEYMDWFNLAKLAQGRHDRSGSIVAQRLTADITRTVIDRLYAAVSGELGWHPRTRVADSLRAASPYLSTEMVSEAILSLGCGLHEHAAGAAAGVVNVGPMECMPTKIAEAQFHHAAEQTGLIPLTVYCNGDPVDPELLDNFAHEVHRRAEIGAAERAL